MNNRTPSIDSVLGNPGPIEICFHPEVQQNVQHCPLPVYDMSNYHQQNEFSLDAEGNIVITKNKPKMTLNLSENKDAPLASPETLSERSSIASSGSLKNISGGDRNSLRKSVQSPLETIQQSPTVLKSPNEGVSFAIPTEHQDSNLNNVVNSTAVQIESQNADVKMLENHIAQNNHCLIHNSNLEDLQYERHSPVETNHQTEYGNPNCFYSAAGLGYPHFVNEEREEAMSEDSETTSEINRLIEEEAENLHLPLQISHSDCMKLQKKSLHSSQSDSFLQSLSEKYVMRRSKEQGDIAHLQDINNVFEIEDLIAVHDVNCNQPYVYSQRNGSRGSISAEEDSELRLSTSHSDDIFEMPIEETDV